MNLLQKSKKGGHVLHFVIFWLAVFAIFFFVLEIFFKVIIVFLNSLLKSLGKVIAIVGISFLVTILLYLIYAIIHGITENGFASVFGETILAIILSGLLFAIIGGLGTALVELVILVVGYVLNIITFVLRWFAELFEQTYSRCLNSIITKLDKC